MMNQPLVSMIICTYNREKYLGKAIQSIVDQAVDNYEIIVIDNASTDNTRSVAQKYAVKYYYEPVSGLSNARNCGIENSKGRFVAFVDDDGTISSEWLTSVMEAFEKFPDAGMAAGPVVPVYEKKPPDWMPRDVWELKFGNGKTSVTEMRNALPGGNSIYRRSAIGDQRFCTKLGRKKNSLISGEDTEFSDRLLKIGVKALYVPRAVLYHTIQSERISLKWLMKRAFAEGVTEYRACGARVIYRRLHKPLLGVFSLFLSVLTLNRKKICKRWLRLIQNCGVVFGWVVR